MSCARVPFHVQSEDDAYTAAQGMQEGGGKVIPFFTTSSVSGRNIPLLTAFLNVLSPRKNSLEQEQLMQLPVKFQVGLPLFSFKVSICRVVLTAGVTILDYYYAIHSLLAKYTYKFAESALFSCCKGINVRDLGALLWID